MRIRVRFKIRRGTFGVKHAVSGGMFVGLIRGFEKAGQGLHFLNAVEYDSTEKFYIIEITMREKNFKFAKGQAESYGVIVEKVTTK